MDQPITRIVVAGGGIAGWSAAAALKRHLGPVVVEIVNFPLSQSMIDQVISTLPSIFNFHDDLGLGEEDTVVRAGSSLRAGTLFQGWSQDDPPYVHAYGNYGNPLEGTPFHQQWLRAQKSRTIEQFDRFSPAAESGRSGRVAVPGERGEIAATVGYGLQLTIGRYQELIRAYALHLGVIERRAEIADVLLSKEGSVDKLLLSDGPPLVGDLFVDCTGQSALIRSKLGGAFTSWSRWLPCEKVLIATGDPNEGLQLLDQVNAIDSGWQWSASSSLASSYGIVFSPAHAKAEDVIAEHASGSLPSHEITLRPGRWAEPWLKNCVAIGEAAVSVEPLEWTGLHIVHSQIDRLVSMMPGRECNPVELVEYNRQCNLEADRIRDFICLHYVTARRDEPFWKEASVVEPPDSLGHSLALFRERGRLPYYEEETFSRDSWLAVLLGQGLRPRRTDPLAEIVPVEEAVSSIVRYREAVKKFVDAQPVYHQSIPGLVHHP